MSSMLSGLRNLPPLTNKRFKPVSASIPITYRDKSISEEELFQYTNGRFLVKEKEQFAKRYLKFNIGELSDVVAAADHQSAKSSRWRVDSTKLCSRREKTN